LKSHHQLQNYPNEITASSWKMENKCYCVFECDEGLQTLLPLENVAQRLAGILGDDTNSFQLEFKEVNESTTSSSPIRALKTFHMKSKSLKTIGLPFQIHFELTSPKRILANLALPPAAYEGVVRFPFKFSKDIPLYQREWFEQARICALLKI